MPVIRFVREGRDVECFPGENLREIALREGLQLYGLKGALGNCGGCGQCITCFVEIPEGPLGQALSARTSVEEQKLRRRPQNWRLACQALVQQSLLVITRPQVGFADRQRLLDQALAQPLPTGPTSWPEPEVEEGPGDLSATASDDP
jgi:ferredoxin